MITRRQFLAGVIGGTTLYIVGIYGNGRRPEIMAAPTARGATADEPPEINLSHLTITMPLWLLDAEAQSNEPVQLVALARDSAAGEIIFRFGNGQEVRTPASVSARQLVEANGRRAGRQSMLVKRMHAYLIDAVDRELVRLGKLGGYTAIKDRLEQFQREEVLDLVTAGAVYDLWAGLTTSPSIPGIQWDAQARAFVIAAQTGLSQAAVRAEFGEPDQVNTFILPEAPFYGPQESLTGLAPAGTPIEEWLYDLGDEVRFVWFAGSPGQPRETWIVVETAIYPAGAVY